MADGSRGVTMHFAEVDPEFAAGALSGTRAGVTVHLDALERIPAPSPWRHPIAWLRWNPQQRIRVRLTLHNADVERGDDGGIRISPANPADDPFPYLGDPNAWFAK